MNEISNYDERRHSKVIEPVAGLVSEDGVWLAFWIKFI